MILTADLAHAAATDAADRSMRARGGKRWNKQDRDAMLAEIERLAPYVPGWTPENPLRCYHERQ